MKELPKKFIIEKMTIDELRAEAKARGLTKGIWRLLRSDLVDLLYSSSKQDNQNNDCGKEHDDPQKADCDDVGV
jgi:hypothetical protein